jgi:hypothetical protein
MLAGVFWNRGAAVERTSCLPAAAWCPFNSKVAKIDEKSGHHATDVPDMVC